MNKFPKFILNIATCSLIITLLSLIIGNVSNDETTQAITSGITLYGTIFTIYLLLFHLLLTVIAYIIHLIKDKNRS